MTKAKPKPKYAERPIKGYAVRPTDKALGQPCPLCGEPAYSRQLLFDWHTLACGHRLAASAVPAASPAATSPTSPTTTDDLTKSLGLLLYLKTCIGWPCPLCPLVDEGMAEKRIRSRNVGPNQTTFVLECGHSVVTSTFGLVPSTTTSPNDHHVKPDPDGKVVQDSPRSPAATLAQDPRFTDLRPYQRDGVEFLAQHGWRAVIGDEMGLGKTIQAIFALRGHRELFPLLIVVPANLQWKWARELKAWLLDHPMHKEDVPIMVQQSDGCFVDGFNVHILSMARLQGDAMAKGIREYGFQTVIVDEAHSFKEDKSQRTKVLMAGIAQIPHRILLTGTAVMNRPQEYFNLLHIVAPRVWPSRRWLDYYCKFAAGGRAVGLDEHKRDEFFRKTADHVIRRKKTDVAKDLPPFTREYSFIPINSNKEAVVAYNKALDELERIIDEKANGDNTQNILGIMARIRHLLGLTKVPYLVEQGISFLEQAEPGDKFTIGTYHALVNEYVCKGINEWIDANPEYGWKHVLTVTDEPPQVKDARIKEFKDDPKRGMLAASIRGAGLGLDIQFCNEVLIGERDWNRALEAQFEGRFHRIGSTLPTTAEYLMAQNTLDQFFHELVQLKEGMVDSFLDLESQVDTRMLAELAKKLLATRLKYVGA